MKLFSTLYLTNLKLRFQSVSVYLALVGLIDAIIRPGGTPIQLGINGSLAVGMRWFFVFGLFVTIVLFVRK